jgi:hypothetical protein
MSWAGPQIDCSCGWSNFTIRKRCRNCGTDLQSAEAPMKHARADYDAVQEITTNGTTRRIPANEPVFLIRGQDIVSGDAVRAWADMAEKSGAAPDIVQVARDHAAKMDAWPKKKVADLPPSNGEG